MSKVSCFLFSSVLLGFFSCSSVEDENRKEEFSYTVSVKEKMDLAIPSGSGITGYKSGFLTVGDDTPWMYYLDSTGVLTDSLRLSTVQGYVPGVRMDGSFKADFEGITRLNEEIVLVISSGSYTSARDTAYLVNAEEKRILAKKSLGPLFERFAEMGGLDDVHKLNIEGVSVAEHEIYFFNRGDLSGKNLIFKTDLSEFISFFTSDDTLTVKAMYSPSPYNEEYGSSTFSSCVYIPQAKVFIFISTSEQGSRMDSTGTVIDGEIKGSFIGRIRMNELNDSLLTVNPILEGGELAAIKVEGIWMHQALSDSVINFIGVSDPDNGTTDTYIIQVKINRLR